MQSHWFKNAVIYCLEVDVFKDGNGDGIGDFIGLRQGLSYLAGLGVSCIWLLPFFKSPDRDDGYDVMDYLSVDPVLGDLGDFAAFMDEARDHGIRVIIDLVVNHTSNQHPWFQLARRKDPKYFDYYVWRTDAPGKTADQVAFPGKQSGVWQYDRLAKAYYFHRFYSYQPDLNTANPAVREEIKKILGFWAALGVSGFRVDAAPFVISAKGADADKHPHESYEFLHEFREFLRWKTGDAILLAEANVAPEQLTDFFGPEGQRMNMLLNFYVNPHLFLAIAQQSPEPLVRSLRALPQIPAACHWAYFLRNHDELDLSRLAEPEKEECFRKFAPKKEMQLYDRGIRRRLAPMLDGDLARTLLAYSLIFTIPGTPVFWYGDEIGMGEDLSLEERNSVRTPMQWSGERNGGFSTAPKEHLRRPVISRGKFSFRKVNVQALRREPGSLLNRLERMIRTRKEFPEFGTGTYRILETDRPKTVFAHACEDDAGSAVLAIHNLSNAAEKVSIRLWKNEFDHIVYLFEERQTEPIIDEKIKLDLPPCGYSWLRLVHKV
jgi:maltose alpha-D-glucosyltransferase / alpha-amylase